MDKTAKAAKNSLSVTSLVFGILAVAVSWTVVLGLPNALLAIMFSALSRGKMKRNGQAVAGMLLGIAAILLGIIAGVVIITSFGDMISEFLGSPEDALNQIMDGIRYFEGV